MASDRTKPIPWYAWPFVMIWRLVTGLLKLTGRVLGVVLGVALLIIGIALSMTIFGAIIGIPLAILGVMLITRGLF